GAFSCPAGGGSAGRQPSGDWKPGTNHWFLVLGLRGMAEAAARRGFPGSQFRDDAGPSTGSGGNTHRAAGHACSINGRMLQMKLMLVGSGPVTASLTQKLTEQGHSISAM